LALVAVVLTGGAFVLNKNTVTTPVQQAAAVAVTQATPTQSGAQQLAQAIPAQVVAPSSRYKDGTYTATGDYAAPGGVESIDVSVTLKNGLIVDSSVTGTARNHDSRRFEQQFIAGYKSYVTGKSIDKANLGTVSGASLTGAGWNTALESIKAQAAV